MTKYKKGILELINESSSHMTAEEVFIEFRKLYPDVVLATVYNNLNALVEEGKIRRITLDGQIDRYDKILKHDHLVCKKCGKLIDINFTDITDKITKECGYNILGYDLKAFIICDECAAKDGTNS